MSESESWRSSLSNSIRNIDFKDNKKNSCQLDFPNKMNKFKNSIDPYKKDLNNPLFILNGERKNLQNFILKEEKRISHVMPKGFPKIKKRIGSRFNLSKVKTKGRDRRKTDLYISNNEVTKELNCCKFINNEDNTENINRNFNDGIIYLNIIYNFSI
jgi:hypothetical protein